MNNKEKKTKIPRPLNAFMLFANDNRAKYRKANLGETNSKISVRLGEAWKQLNGKEKTKYYQLSKKAELEHRKKFPDYIYTPTEARSRKKSRRLAKSSTSEECLEGKQNDNGGNPHRPTASVSDENCSPNNMSPRQYGFADWKFDPFYQNYGHCLSSGKNDMYQNGQGDQMPHYPMPYGPPPFMSPFGYPRFPSWDFRLQPYMGSQYGRMPFVSPPMMYQYPPQHLPQFPSPTGQSVDGRAPLNYVSHMPGYAQYQPDTEPQKNANKETHAEKQSSDSMVRNQPASSTESRPPECHVHVADQPSQEQLRQQQQIHHKSTGQHHQDTAPSASGPPMPPQAERYQPQTAHNPAPYMYYGTDHPQPYVLDYSRPMPQYFRMTPETKTFADLSNGQPEMVKVPMHPPQ